VDRGLLPAPKTRDGIVILISLKTGASYPAPELDYNGEVVLRTQPYSPDAKAVSAV